MAQGTRFSFEIGRAEPGERLDRAVHRQLAAHLPGPVSRAAARALIEGGTVRLNGKRCDRSSARVEPGDRVTVEIDPTLLPAAPTRVTLTKAAIAYEDDDLIAIDKPSGLPSHATRDPRRDHLLAAVARLLETRDGSAPPEMRLVHRLDAETSGVVLVGKTLTATRALSEAFRAGTVEKVYEAVVHAPTSLPDHWSVERYLAWSRRDRCMRAVRSGGDPSRTDFRRIAQRGDRARVEARPRTGRTHQIRVHLAGGGTPILGDRIYGAHNEFHGTRLLLHSKRIELLHPRTGTPLQIETALPSELLDALS